MTDLTLLGDSPFDTIRRTRPDGSEYWSARDLMPLLGYDRYENFAASITRARLAAANSEGELAASEHFRDARKMVPLGNGAQRDIGDRHLTRHACYLVAMNGDPRKQEIADAQVYFALRTREAETASASTVDVTQVGRRELALAILAAEDRADREALRADKAEQFKREIEGGDGLTLTEFHKKYFSEVRHTDFFEHLYRKQWLIDQRSARWNEEKQEWRDGPQHMHPKAKGKPYLYLHLGGVYGGKRRERTRVRPGEPELAFREGLAREGLKPNDDGPGPHLIEVAS